MTKSRLKILENLLERFRNLDDTNRITLINGVFGTGKSEFLTDFLKELQQNDASDAICYFNFNIDRDFLVDYLTTFDFILPGSEVDSLNYNFDECSYNKEQLLRLLTELRNNGKSSFTDVLNLVTPRFYHKYDSVNSSLDALEVRLNSIFEKNSDIRFLIKHYQVAAESFVVDLMNLFYPITENNPTQLSYLSEIKTPIKITFILDNIDKFTSTISNWLNDSVLPLFLNGKFRDFIAYNIDDEQKDINISDFIDFSFIISSRSDLTQLAGNTFLQNFKDEITKINLIEFDYDETREYLEFKSVDLRYLDVIYSYSHGLPFLIDMFLEYDADELNEVVKDVVYDNLTEKVLDGRNELEREAFMMSAYFEKFDADALRCNSAIGDEYKNLFDYLRFNNDFYESNNDAFLALKEPFKTVFLKSLERNNKSRVIEYKAIAQIYSKVWNRYHKLNSEEINILRSLAYFKNFDHESSVDLAFDDKSISAKKFIKNNPDYFIKNKQTMSLLQEHRLFLDEYNKIIDRRKYELKIQFISSIWKEKESELKAEKEEIEAKLASLKNELKVYGDDPTKVKKEYDSHQKQFIENENELIKLRKEQESFSASRYFSSLIVNLTAAVMSFIIGYFFPDLFSTPNNHSSIIMIQYVLYFISIVFLLMGLNFGLKIIQTKRNNGGLSSIKEQINILDEEKIEHQKEMKNLREISANWQKGVNELTEQIRTKEERLKVIEILLLESYI